MSKSPKAHAIDSACSKQVLLTVDGAVPFMHDPNCAPKQRNIHTHLSKCGPLEYIRVFSLAGC